MGRKLILNFLWLIARNHLRVRPVFQTHAHLGERAHNSAIRFAHLMKTFVSREVCGAEHNMQNQHQQVCQMGPNPLDYIGVYRAIDGRTLVAERNSQLQWVAYSDYTQGVALPLTWLKPSDSVLPLSIYAASHDYVTDNGYHNFATWVANCARNAGC